MLGNKYLQLFIQVGKSKRGEKEVQYLRVIKNRSDVLADARGVIEKIKEYFEELIVRKMRENKKLR